MATTTRRELRPRNAREREELECKHELLKLQDAGWSQRNPSTSCIHQLDDNGWTRLSRSIVGVRHVRRLIIPAPNTIRSAREFANAIRHSRLTCLEISAYRGKNISRVMKILYLDGIKLSLTVRELRMRGDVGDADALNEILPDLRKLTLDIIDLKYFDKLSEGWATCCSLEELNLQHLGRCLRERHFTALSRASIKTMEFYCCTFDPVFIRDWPADSVLQELRVRYGVDAECAVSLVRATASHPSLKTLYISGNMKMGFAGLRSIAEMLASNVLVLQHLTLIENTDDFNLDQNYESQQFHNDKKAMAQLFSLCLLTNTHLHTLHLSSALLNVDGERDKLDRVIHFVTARNVLTSLMLSSEIDVPLGIWCHTMAFYKNNASCIFFILQQLPGNWGAI